MPYVYGVQCTFVTCVQHMMTESEQVASPSVQIFVMSSMGSSDFSFRKYALGVMSCGQLCSAAGHCQLLLPTLFPLVDLPPQPVTPIANF